MARYWAALPNIWPLLPRRLNDTAIALDLHGDGDLQRQIIQKLIEARTVEYPNTGRVPIVTAVQRVFGNTNGIRLRGTW